MQDTNPNIHSTEIREIAEQVHTCELSKQQVERVAALLQTLAQIHETLTDLEFSSDTFQLLNNLFGIHGLELFGMDSELDEESLQQKYRGDPGEAKMPNQHPKWPLAEWTSAVAKGETERGYWEWVKVMIEDGE